MRKSEVNAARKDPRCYLVATLLDYPSVYMGGPSDANLRRALRIISALSEEGHLAKGYDRSDDTAARSDDDHGHLAD